MDGTGATGGAGSGRQPTMVGKCKEDCSKAAACLSVEGCGVMEVEEHIQDLAERDHVGIVRDLTTAATRTAASGVPLRGSMSSGVDSIECAGKSMTAYRSWDEQAAQRAAHIEASRKAPGTWTRMDESSKLCRTSTASAWPVLP